MKLKWILVLITAIVVAGFSIKSSKEIEGIVYESGSNQVVTGVKVAVRSSGKSTLTDSKGEFRITVPSENSILVFVKSGYRSVEKKVGSTDKLIIYLNPGVESDTVYDEVEIVEEILVEDISYESERVDSKSVKRMYNAEMQSAPTQSLMGNGIGINPTFPHPEQSSEDYAEIKESGFLRPGKTPLSTFSIDVDAASYSNVRRFLNNGQLPPSDAVRVEEMINYFNYNYPQPSKNIPFSVNTEINTAPWNDQHQLVHIGIQGRKIPTEDLPASNLVFLLDVSGSMNNANKLPLLKSAFKLLVEQLRPEDKVAIVVYAGAAGMVLEPTSGDKKSDIMAALRNLSAGGSTAGGAGIELAYATAKKHFVKGGNNRIILATDGDFNVGASSNKAMEDLIEEKRNDGIYLTVLGFGMGNYKDSKMELLADKGNGNYAYIDNIQEAKKVLVNEFGGTMFTIAKDVKIQVEFNPQNVQAYRLIGYENRALNDEDFNNDKKDAGELGAGHTVTALYEVIPVGVESSFSSVDPLKYQQQEEVKKSGYSDELLTVKLRYKDPEGDEKSKLIVETVKKANNKKATASENFRWSASVAAFGMLLRDSDYTNGITYDQVASIAQSARGKDEEGYRSEFIRLVKSSSLLAKSE